VRVFVDVRATAKREREGRHTTHGELDNQIIAQHVQPARCTRGQNARPSPCKKKNTSACGFERLGTLKKKTLAREGNHQQHWRSPSARGRRQGMFYRIRKALIPISREGCPGKFRFSELPGRSKSLKGVEFLQSSETTIVGNARIPRPSNEGWASQLIAAIRRLLEAAERTVDVPVARSSGSEENPP